MEKRVTSNMVHRREGPPVHAHGNGLRAFAISFSLKKQSSIPPRLSPVKSLSINDITPQSVFGGQSPSDSDGEDKITVKIEQEEPSIGSVCHTSMESESLKKSISKGSHLPTHLPHSSIGSGIQTPMQLESHSLPLEVLPAMPDIEPPSPLPVTIMEEKDGQIKGEISGKNTEEMPLRQESLSHKRKRSRSRSAVDVRKKRRSISRDRRHHSRRCKVDAPRRRSVDIKRRDRDSERRNGHVNGNHPTPRLDQVRRPNDTRQRDKEILPSPDSDLHRVSNGRRNSQSITTTMQSNQRHQLVMPPECDVKPPRELTRLSTTRPRLFVSAARAHAADFIALWDSTSMRSGVKELKRSIALPSCDEEIPLPAGDSRESSVGVIVDEATNISEPIDMQLEEEEEVKEEPQPGPLDINHHPRVSFSLPTGLRKGSNPSLKVVETALKFAALPEKSLTRLDLSLNNVVLQEEDNQDAKIARFNLPTAKAQNLKELISESFISTSKSHISFPLKTEPEVEKPVVKVSFSMPKKSMAIPEKRNGILDTEKVKKAWMEEDEQLHRRPSLTPSAPMLATYASFLHDLKLPSVESKQEPLDELNVAAVVDKEMDLDTSSGASDVVIDHAEVDADLVSKMKDVEVTHAGNSLRPLQFRREHGEESEISRPVETSVTFSRPVSRVSVRNSPRHAASRRSRSRSRSLRRSDSGSIARSHRRSRSPVGRTRRPMDRRSRSPDRRRPSHSKSPSQSPESRPFHSKITMNIQRELQAQQPQYNDTIKDPKSAEKEGRPLKRSLSPDYRNSKRRFDRRPTKRRSRSPPRRSRERSSRQSAGREGDHCRSDFRRHSRDREAGRRTEKTAEKENERFEVEKAPFRRNYPRWTSKNGGDSRATSPAGHDLTSTATTVDDLPPTSGSLPTRNGFAERYGINDQHAYLKKTYSDNIRVSAESRPPAFKVRNPSPVKVAWPSTEVSKVPLEAEFPTVIEPAVGTFPVPFNFTGTGPVFCWPYYMPDGTIVLVPYLGLEKAPDASSLQQLVAVSRLVEPPPLLISGCPLGYTPFNLSAIPTYDPTRAIPPPPPCATAPLNQPTKPSVLKLIRIQQKERERIKRQRAEKDKLQPVFDTPTPTSESLSSKTTTPLPGDTGRIVVDNAAVLVTAVIQQVI